MFSSFGSSCCGAELVPAELVPVVELGRRDVRGISSKDELACCLSIVSSKFAFRIPSYDNIFLIYNSYQKNNNLIFAIIRILIILYFLI